MAWDSFKDHPKIWITVLLIIILGCIAGIVAPAIVIDNSSKIAPIVIFSIILLFFVAYMLYKIPGKYRTALISILYLCALAGGIVGISVASIDTGIKTSVIIFLSLLLLLSIIIVVSYSSPTGEKIANGVIYTVLIGGLIASIALIASDTIGVSDVKVLTLICLGILLFFVVIFGIISLRNKSFGKFNVLGLNPVYQIKNIKSWGFTKSGAFVMLLILIVSVVMLYIGGAYFIDVYQNTSPESNFDKNFALVWAIINFVIAAWITIQTIYFLIALGMMYWEDTKKKCLDTAFSDIDPDTGLPREGGKLEKVLKEDFNLVYSSTDPTKPGYNNTIIEPGIINNDGIFIPQEFLESDGITIINKPEIRLALEAYMENHRRKVIAGEEIVIPNRENVRALIDFALRELRNNGVPNEIVESLRERFETVEGQAVRYQTAEAAAAQAREARELAERQEAVATEEARRRIIEAQNARNEAQDALRERNDALAAANEGQRLAAEEGTRARRAIAEAEARAAGREAAAGLEILQATSRTREANERVRIAEAEISRERTRLQTAIDNEQRISEAAQNALDRYNQSRDTIERERATLDLRILNARNDTVAEETARCNQRINELRVQLDGEISNLRTSVADLNTSLGTVINERDALRTNLQQNETILADLRVQLTQAGSPEQVRVLNMRIENLTRDNLSIVENLRRTKTSLERTTTEARANADRIRAAEAESEAALTRAAEAERVARENALRATAAAEERAIAAELRAATAAEALRAATAEQERQAAEFLAAQESGQEVNQLKEQVLGNQLSDAIKTKINTTKFKDDTTDSKKIKSITLELARFINSGIPPGILIAGVNDSGLTETQKTDLKTFINKQVSKRNQIRGGGAGGP